MYAQLVGGRSGKFGVAVLKASMLDWWGRSASKSARFGVVVFRASMLKGGVRSAKFGVAVLKAYMLDQWGVDLPIHLPSMVQQF